ncbi:MAG TPA: hypothetical protein VJU82_04330 [Acidobacteriaceae bacterium]|nr:hypothetical protein [Acidobacteriaceae bacterium]
MHSEPNPLRRELAKARPSQAHPDADILTAFTEGSLLNRERKDVIEHLATCTECRDVVNMSISSAPEVMAERTASATVVGLGYRQWMPWAAGVAACLVVVATVMVARHYSSKPGPSKDMGYVARVERPQVAPADEARPATKQAPAAKATAPVAVERRRNPISREQLSVKRESSLQEAPQTRSRPAAGLAAASPAAPAVSESQSAAKGLQSTKGPEVQQELKIDQVAQSAKISAQAALAPPPAPTSLAEVAPEEMHGAVARKAAPSAPKPSFLAGAISSNGAVSDSSAVLHWRVSPEGRVERQAGSGPWEPMLSAEPAKMRVVSKYGSTVWAGGDNQRLYRSSDNGATWTAVALPNKGTASHSIAHIRFTSPEAGTVEAEDGTRWITTNAGATWE